MLISLLIEKSDSGIIQVESDTYTPVGRHGTPETARGTAVFYPRDHEDRPPGRLPYRIGKKPLPAGRGRNDNKICRIRISGITTHGGTAATGTQIIGQAVRHTSIHNHGGLQKVGYPHAEASQLPLQPAVGGMTCGKVGIGIIRIMLVHHIAYERVVCGRLHAKSPAPAYAAEPHERFFQYVYAFTHYHIFMT